MKKIFFLAAAMVAAMSINAQVVKTLDELANYIDFQQAGITSSTTVPTSVESTWFHFDNGTVCKGFLKSDETEAANSWNVKESYNTACPAVGIAGVDTIKVGTMFRAASGSSIVLGAFSTTADGKLRVYFQPNGDSDRGVSISVFKGTPVECSKSGVKINGIRPIYAAEVELEADDYAAGDVVITLIANTSNIFGVEIENLAAAPQGIKNVEVVKATKTIENGQIVILKGNKKFNAMGVEL